MRDLYLAPVAYLLLRLVLLELLDCGRGMGRVGSMYLACSGGSVGFVRS